MAVEAQRVVGPFPKFVAAAPVRLLERGHVRLEILSKVLLVFTSVEVNFDDAIFLLRTY